MPDSTAPDDDDLHVRPFADVLRAIDEGMTLDKAAEAMYDLVAAVKETGKPGTVTLTLRVQPAVKGRAADPGEIATVVVFPSVVTKRPEAPPRPATFFVDGQGQLSKDYPGQMKFSDTQLALAEGRKAANQ